MTKIFASLALLSLALLHLSYAVKEPLVAPYVDVTRMSDNYLVDIYHKTGLKAVTLAFVLGGAGGCVPSWGGEIAIEDAKILTAIKNFQKVGGQVILSTGGAAGPYLEASCGSPDQLVSAYKKAFQVVGTHHLDIDIEASINIDHMNEALKKLQADIPDVTVSFTLMIQGDDYGLTDALGVGVIKSAAAHGVNVDIVNAMTMEFGSSLPSWGDAVISASEATHKQMKLVWPSKSDAELYAMLGVTPMIGRNFNGKIFLQEHAKKLVSWAKSKKVGHLAFWSLGRDNGKCPNGGVSPDCSSISQQELEFTKIFQEYAGTHIPDDHETTKKPDDHHTDGSTTEKPAKPTTPKPHPKPDCSNGAIYIPHETDCDKYYWCFEGKPHLEHCGDGTVWDPRINACNYKKDAHRTDCK